MQRFNKLYIYTGLFYEINVNYTEFIIVIRTFNGIKINFKLVAELNYT